MKIKAVFEPFIEDFKGKDRWLIAGYLFLAVLMLMYLYLGKYAFFKHGGYGILKNFRGQERVYMMYLGWFVSSFFILFVVPVVFIAFNKNLKFSDFGLVGGEKNFSRKILLFFSLFMLITVALIIMFKVDSFLRYYPMYGKHLSISAKSSFPLWFVLMEVGYLLYFIGWEFYFRSLILFPLYKKIGSLAALFGVLPFAIMHAGKPVLEAFGSIIAAYLLGILVLKTRNFWVAPVIHFIVAFGMDLGAALSKGYF